MDEHEYEDPGYEEADISACPMCGEENVPIGWLGRLRHYSCRFCGMWWSVTEERE